MSPHVPLRSHEGAWAMRWLFWRRAKPCDDDMCRNHESEERLRELERREEEGDRRLAALERYARVLKERVDDAR